jgi:negative regulator of sigma E activity
VNAGAGVVRVDGEAKMAATSSQRWAFRNGDWDLMSPAGLGQLPLPVTDKYRFVTSAGTAVAGRATELVQLRTAERVEERWYLDQETGLLLRREQLDATGTVTRSVTFDAITLTSAGATTPPAPAASVDLRPHLATHIDAPLVAPGALASGYRKIGMFRREKALQVVYSDGVHGLSLFEQPGRLDRSSVPSGGRPVAVGPAGGFHWVYPGGQVVVWEARGSTFTAVGDGSPEDVLAASRSIPSAPRRSLLARLRRACSQVVNAVSGP